MQYLSELIQYQDKELKKLLRRWQKVTGNNEEIMNSIGEKWLALHQDRHEKGQAPNGSAWKALRPSTLAQKRALIGFPNSDKEAIKKVVRI